MESNFGRAFDTLPAMMWTAAPDGRIDFVNRRWSDYTGLSLDEAHGWEWQAVVSADDLPKLLEHWRSILASGESGEMDARVRRFDGEYRWFRVHCSPMHDESGQIIKWCGVGTDVDDLRRAQETLRQCELDFQLIVDSIPIPVAVTTPSGEVEGLNQRTLDYFGKSLEELKGWKASDVVHPDDLEQTIAAQLEAHQKGSTYNVESRHRRADGVYRWYNVLGMPLRDSQGDILRWLHLLVDIDDRKRAEEALSASERYARSIVDSIPGMVAAFTPDGELEFVNRQIVEFFGKQFEELRRWATSDMTHPEDLPRAVESFTRSIASGEPFEDEVRARRFDGVYRWFQSRGFPLRDTDGRIVRWYNLLIDIDERKRAEEALLASEREARLIVDSIPGQVAIFSPNGEVELVNNRLREYYGATLEELQSWASGDSIHPDDLPRAVEIFAQAMASGQPFKNETRNRRSDGVYRWFESRVRPLKDADGRIVRWYGLFVDVDDRKRAERALQESERQLRLIVDTIPGQIAVFGPQGEVEGLNEQFLAYLGQTQEEFANWASNGTVHPDDLVRHIDTLKRSLGTGVPIDFETRLRRFDGVYRWFQVRGNAVRDAAANIVRWYCVMSDIDERKRAEESLTAGERNLNEIINTIPVLAWSARPDGSTEFFNQHYLHYAGLSIGQSKDWVPTTALSDYWDLTAAVHPDDVDGLVAAWEAILASGKSGEAEARLRRFDGIYRWFLVRANPLCDEAGNIVKWYGVSIDIDDRKHAEQALRESERSFKLIIDTIPALAWSARPDGSAEFFSKHYLDYVGLSAEQAQDWGWTVAVHPDDLNGLAATWQAIMASGNQGEAEARLRRFDGDYRWLLFRANPLRDASGNIVKWYGVNTDIDDRKRAETNLAHEKHLLEMIASGSPLRDVLSELCKMVEEAGPGCYCDVHPIDWSGPSIEYSVAPSLPASYTDPIAGLSLSGDALPCAIAVRQKVQVVAEDMDTDPRWHDSSVRTHVLDHGLRSVWSTPIYAKDGHVLATLCLYQRQPASPSQQHQSLIAHATHLASIAIERSRTEAALRRSETLLAEGQQLSSTGSFSWRVDTDELAFSEELRRIFEFDPKAVVTLEQVRTRVHPEDLPLLSAQMARVRAGHGNLDYDIRLRMPDDRVKHLRTFGRVVRHQDGRLECLAAVQDVTERRLADEALSKARSDLAHVTRVSSLGALTASIAHEVNQPLSGIITNASTCLRMLAADPPDIDVARETARRTIRDGNRAADVIARLRTLFSKRTVSIEPIDLNEAAREVLALSWGDLQRSGVVVRTELEDRLPLVGGDRVQLQQVIMNLLRNAADAMSGLHDRPRQLLIRTEQDEDNHVRLSVQDTGIGFGPDGTERLFEAFYTTKSDGMGIGLSVSRSIIESHRGRLWGQTNDGPGVTFSFSIPAHSEDEKPIQEVGALHAPVASNAQSSAGIS